MNQILEQIVDPAVDISATTRPTILRRQSAKHRRDIRDLRRAKSAVEAIHGFDRSIEIYGFTKGQFSIIDLITAAIDHTGPVHIVVSTWTAANADVSQTLELCRNDKILSSRWLMDISFQRRQPELANEIRNTFGHDAIRVASNHAKFYLLHNDAWKVVIQTSMNLNFNPRFENFSIAHDPELFDFHKAIIDEVWSKQSKSQAFARPHQSFIQFTNEL